MPGFLLSSTGLAETVVALATYSLTSVRYPTFDALSLKRAHNCSAWTLSDPSRTLFECFEGSLTAAALNAIVHTLSLFHVMIKG